MKYEAVLFDLDGTLLPMDQDRYVEKYFEYLTAFMCASGNYEPKKYYGAIWQGVKAMLKNNGSVTNEELYFKTLAQIFTGHDGEEIYKKYADFYKTKYVELKEVCGCTPQAREIIDLIKGKGVKVALATNPVFPAIATNERMSWGGLSPGDFSVVTTCDNIGFSKPSPQYYREVAKRMGVDPARCLMVGNDVDDDMPAMSVGMDVFLLTDCLINKKSSDITKYPNGSFDDLIAYVKSRI